AALARPLLESGTIADATGGLGPMMHGLYWLISNLADRGPLALLVDDVQWADVPSETFLEYLAARVRDLPVAVVVSLRTDEPGAPALLRSADHTHRLRPLSMDAVSLLVRERFTDADGALCRACAEATGGNPFYLSELLASLGDVADSSAATIA